jgi:hypothetical protein
MALRIECPNGCRLHVPSSRMGATLRCPACKALIDIPSESSLKEGLKAQLSQNQTRVVQSAQVKQPKRRDPSRRKPVSSEVITDAGATKSVKSTEPQLIPAPLDSATRNRIEPTSAPAITKATSKGTHGETIESSSPAVSIAPPPLIGTPAGWPPISNREPSSSHSIPSVPIPQPPPRATDSVNLQSVAPAFVRHHGKSTSPIAQQINTDAPSTSSPRAPLERAGVFHNPSQRMRATYLSLGMLIVSIVSLIPVGMYLVETASVSQQVIATWVGILMLLGAVNLVYAVYVYQLADWTSVWVAACWLLANSVILAVTLSALALSGPAGRFTGLIGMSVGLHPKAILWLLMMLSLTGLMAYLAGRESFRWKRDEQKLRAIFGE